MFEFDNSRTLLEEENERKPNRYAAGALRIGLLSQAICLLLNELGFFHVDKTTMRVCVAIGAVCSLIPQVIARSEKLSADPRSKYFALGCVCGMCFVLSLALFLFALPLCLLPMLLAVQYNSRRMSYMAIGGSCLCVAVAPPLGCAMKLWDVEFLRFLISSTLGREMVLQEAVETTAGPMTTGVLGVIMFLSFPWLLSVLMLSKLILTATQKGEDSIAAQIKVVKRSRLDALTGLYNQNVYEQYLKAPVGLESAGVLFFDVDGLKAANDSKGHEYGDLLLCRCAESLQEIFDDTCHGFRIGGDEFLVVVDTEDPQAVERKGEQWRRAMERINLENRTRHPGLVCHMSMGSAFGPKCELGSLIVKADKRMYAEKVAYHKAAGTQLR